MQVSPKRIVLHGQEYKELLVCFSGGFCSDGRVRLGLHCCICEWLVHRCSGNQHGIIRKYGLDMTRRDFREKAEVMGWKKYR
mmetsp:Transcript_41967/g.84440  ORF Transcript_41967/g.84440 Transcript_41967/m.84440 type:complete len:82 (+) Transcript_41967:163-408(+)